MNAPPRGWAEVMKARREGGVPPSDLPPDLPEPTLTALAVNFATATAQWAASGFPVVDQAAYDVRAAACVACEFWDGGARLGLGKCKHAKCGCTRFKRWLATEQCPMGKWPSFAPAAPMRYGGRTQTFGG